MSKIQCCCLICKTIVSSANIAIHYKSNSCLHHLNKSICQICNIEHSKKTKFCSKICGDKHKVLGYTLRGFTIKQPDSIWVSCLKCNTRLRIQNFKRHYSYCGQTYKPIDLSKSQYRAACQFNFKLRDYYDWFITAFPLIESFGWYSPSNKGNNLVGCSRDHMYSVSEGYKNNISAEIIRHPANCQVMQHPQNQKKRSNSSITLEDLHMRIERFNNLYL